MSIEQQKFSALQGFVYETPDVNDTSWQIRSFAELVETSEGWDTAYMVSPENWIFVHNEMV